MENYIVSARKYRPSTFASVIGQNALTTTLKNAIASQKLAHAYLFCGPRGVGKTTCARIFAKTINCLAPTADGEPCNECESCVAFNEQRSYNIYELDAASNNSVDDIRALVEQVRIPPQIGRYKVYIIDEVHMLSTSAFNAFLKTLEEPPVHAIFILATTEKHKIIPTILSRCQTFDFNRMDVEDIVNHLTYVAQKEGYKAEPEALNVIAQKADGGMRDALSIFDQVVSFTGGDITYEKVIANLNVLDYDYYFRLTDMLLECKVSESLLLFNEILGKGFEGDHFITGLAGHFRNLLVSKDESTLPLLQVGASIRKRYSEQAAKCPLPFIYKAMKLCNDCDMNYRASKNKRLLVELTLIQVAQLTQADDDLSGGRRPKRQLKPIFSRLLAAQQPADNSGSTTPTVAAATTQQQSQQKQPQTAPQQPQQHQSVAEQLANSYNTEQRKPVIGRQSLGISIKGGRTATDNKVAQEQAIVAPAATTATTAKEIDDMVFSEKDLRHYWIEYAGRLPKDYVAFARRMQMIQPALQKDGTTFEIVVDNELSAKDFNKMSGHILGYLRKSLKNKDVQMKVRVSETQEMVRAVGRVEKFTLMAKKNPALIKFKEAFGLELY
jgi:DNA polymerase-3 subunit gamma/tau